MKVSSAERKNKDPLAPGLDISLKGSFDNDIYEKITKHGLLLGDLATVIETKKNAV